MNNQLRLLIFLLFSTFSAFSQIVADDFEGNGNITTWFGDDCSMNTQFANPVPGTGNTSATVLRYADTGGQYANIRFQTASTFPMQASAVFSLKIYISTDGITGNQPFQVALKLQDGNQGQPWETQTEIVKSVVPNEWQTVTFDFVNDGYWNFNGGSPPPILRNDLNRVVIQVNGENNNDHVTAYIDDFYYDGTPPPEPIYDELVWSDEFDQDGALDVSKWFPQTQLPSGGSWFNGEVQHYTDRTDNAFVENGILKLTAKRETYTDQEVTKSYTSARLNSKFAFTFGKIEVRAKMPRGVGTWPAIWMLGQNISESGAYWANQGFGTTGWPACGEIDIIEHWGANQNYVQSAVHTPSSYGNTENYGGRMLPTTSDDFHNYAVKWTPQRLVFTVDDEIHYIYEPEVQNTDTWPMIANMYILLNIAIQPQIAASFTEDAMEIDYVRVYQESTVNTTDELIQDRLRAYPNPVHDTMLLEFPNDGLQGTANIRFFDFSGRLLQTSTAQITDGEMKLTNWDSLPSGSYILDCRVNQQSYSIKVVKH